MMEIFFKNTAALRDEGLKNVLLHLARCSAEGEGGWDWRYCPLEDGNFFSIAQKASMYEDMERELLCDEERIVQNSPRYPFIFLYGAANGMLIKRLCLRGYRHIFVFESDLELLFWALSGCDLSAELASGGLHFFNPLQKNAQSKLALIFNNPHILQLHTLMPFFVNNSFYERLFSLQISHTQSLCALVFNNLLNSKAIPFPELVFQQYENLLRNTPLMLSSLPLQRLFGAKRAAEVAVVVSAGPSLQKDLALLKKEQNRLVIFAVDAVLQTLCEEGIEADFVLSSDYDEMVLEFFKILPAKALFVCSYSSSHKLVAFLKSQNLPLCVALSTDEPSVEFAFFEKFGFVEMGNFVSYFAYTLALKMGFRHIIMLGQDLALSAEGNSHAQGYAFGTRRESSAQGVSYFEVEMWGGGECLTHSTWNFYRLELEGLIASHDGVKFYNASGTGARIAGAVELEFGECLEGLDLREKSCMEDWEEFEACAKEPLEKFFLLMGENIEICEFFIEQSLAFRKNLREVLRIGPARNLLEKTHQNIEKFNAILAENQFLNDGKLNHAFVRRGELWARVLKQKSKTEERYLFKFIAYYARWLEIFANALDEKKSIIKNSLNCYF